MTGWLIPFMDKRVGSSLAGKTRAILSALKMSFIIKLYAFTFVYQLVCMTVCFSVRLRVLKTRSNFTQFSVYVTCGRGCLTAV